MASNWWSWFCNFIFRNTGDKKIKTLGFHKVGHSNKEIVTSFHKKKNKRSRKYFENSYIRIFLYKVGNREVKVPLHRISNKKDADMSNWLTHSLQQLATRIQNEIVESTRKWSQCDGPAGNKAQNKTEGNRMNYHHVVIPINLTPRKIIQKTPEP